MLNLTISLLYILSIITVFIWIIKHERTKGHVNQEAIFWIMVFSIAWPISLVFAGIVELFEWMEKVINNDRSSS